MPVYHKIAPYASQFSDDIDNACRKLALDINGEQVEKLLGYLDGLLLWTKAYNLTAITDPKEAFIKHILDCLAVIPVFDNALKTYDIRHVKLLDIGTGAGLPSVIVAILRPDWQITALDSNGKKIRFIRQMVGDLKLSNVNAIASRIEEFEGRFNLITSRAFASLINFVQVSEPLLENGVLCAMKGKVPTDELIQLSNWQQLVTAINVPNLSDERCVITLFR